MLVFQKVHSLPTVVHPCFCPIVLTGTRSFPVATRRRLPSNGDRVEPLVGPSPMGPGALRSSMLEEAVWGPYFFGGNHMCTCRSPLLSPIVGVVGPVGPC